MNTIQRTSAILIVPLVAAALAVSACETEGDVEQTLEEVGEAVVEGAEEVGEAIEEGVSGDEEPQPER